MNRRTRFQYIVMLVALSIFMSAAALQSAPPTKATKIDLNTSTKTELEGLKGIGPALAQNIITARPFKSVEELKNVKGISQPTYEGIKDQVTVHALTAQTAVSKPPVKAKSEGVTRGVEKPAGAPTGMVNINTADKTTLEKLPGVGAATADRIIAARPFKSVEDLKNVKGIGTTKFESLKSQVTVETPKDITRGMSRPETKAPKAVEPANRTDREPKAIHPKLQAGQTVNINTASKEQLESLLGIGPVKAQAIIDSRPYTKTDDIMKVRGIKAETFAKIKDHIVVK